MNLSEAITILSKLPVNPEDRSMINAAVASDNWDPVQHWLQFRIDSGKNYTRTLHVARAWWWNNSDGAFERVLIEWIKQNGVPAC